MASVVARGMLRAAVGAGAVLGGTALLTGVGTVPPVSVTECTAKEPPSHLKRWHATWTRGVPDKGSFHNLAVNPVLEKHASEILPANAVFVPLCGKTVDLEWLATQPEVEVAVGTEAVPKAMEELQERPGGILGFQQVPPEDTHKPRHFKGWAGAVIKPPGTTGPTVGRVLILEGDHFQVEKADIEPPFGSGDAENTFHAVWDRAAMVAIQPADRPQYVDVYDRLLAPGGKILLATFAYDQAKGNGPPFSIPEGDVRTYFSKDKWEVKLLDKHPMKISKFGDLPAEELVFLVTKK